MTRTVIKTIGENGQSVKVLNTFNVFEDRPKVKKRVVLPIRLSLGLALSRRLGGKVPNSGTGVSQKVISLNSYHVCFLASNGWLNKYAIRVNLERI